MSPIRLLALCLAFPLSVSACGVDSTVFHGPDPESSANPLGQTTRYPIVLSHGFNASPTNDWAFFEVADTLREQGYTVIEAEVPPYDSAAVRAQHLVRYVDEALAQGAEKVNIVAHSMGGLDSRYLISSLGYGDVIASLTTISTPHRGSAIADAALKFISGSGAAGSAINALASAWGTTFNNAASDSHLRAAFEALAEASAPAFNAANEDDARVFYQSWAGVSGVGGLRGWNDAEACDGLLSDASSDKMNAQLFPAAAFVSHGIELRPNDGMVTVESARWGEFRGCIRADHLDEVGQIQNTSPDARTGFDHLQFYSDLARGLAERGF